VIEAVNGASRSMIARALDHVALDVSSLDLDEHFRAIADRTQDFFERGNPDVATTDTEIAELGQRQIRNGPAGQCGSRRNRMWNRVMMHDDSTVARRMHIELYRVRTLLERQEKCRQGVLMTLARGASVGNDMGCHGFSRAVGA